MLFCSPFHQFQILMDWTAACYQKTWIMESHPYTNSVLSCPGWTSCAEQYFLHAITYKFTDSVSDLNALPAATSSSYLSTREGFAGEKLAIRISSSWVECRLLLVIWKQHILPSCYTVASGPVTGDVAPGVAVVGTAVCWCCILPLAYCFVHMDSDFIYAVSSAGSRPIAICSLVRNSYALHLFAKWLQASNTVGVIVN